MYQTNDAEILAYESCSKIESPGRYTHGISTTRLYSFVALIALIFGSSVLLSSSAIDTISQVFSPLDMYNFYYGAEFISFNVSSFQIQRVGYDSLPYFGSASSSLVNYAFLKNYDGLIEPYVNMSVVFSEEADDDINFKYTIAKKNKIVYSGKFYASGSTTRVVNNDFAIACDPYDELEVTIKTYDGKTYQSKVEMTIVCMYVRRELLQLTDDDLQATLDVMNVLWTTSENQHEYGDDFHTAAYFAEVHDFNAAWRDGDHIHEGLGFLPQHMKMTNMFEKAMQAVDPSVSLFYWDFTKETGLMSESPMFQESTFGELALPLDSNIGWTYLNDSMLDAAIKNGRWEKTRANSEKTMHGDKIADELASGYGFMRGPWNTNPSPYVSRFVHDKSNALPSCSIYYDWLQMDDFVDFMKNSENGPHSSTHGNIGGVYGCDMFFDLQDQGYILSGKYKSICSKWGFYLKEMYRANLLSAKSDCTIDAHVSWDGTACGFDCDDSKADDLIEMMQTVISLVDYVPEDLDDDGWHVWSDFVCSGDGYRVFVGDHLESASPMDPSFWPIHPTQERLLQLKYMAGGFDEYGWPSETGKKTTWICNHAKCYDWQDLSQPKDYYDDCCRGHFEFDGLLDPASENRSLSMGDTNHDTLAHTDPSSEDYAMPYIYADFSFDHCSDDFDKMVMTLHEAKAQRRQRDRRLQ